MQTLSFCLKRRLSLYGVDFVSEKRVMDIRHMDANLMSPAGLQPAFYVGEVTETPQHFTVCNGSLSIRPDRHLLSLFGIPSDGLVDSEFVFRDIVVQDGVITSYDRVFLELRRNTAVRRVILANDDASGSVSVDPVDDPRSKDTVDPGERVAAMIHHGIDKCAAVMTGGWMDHHSFRLIDNKNILIFVEDIKRDILRQDIRYDKLLYIRRLAEPDTI